MERPNIKKSLGDISLADAHKIYTASPKLFKHVQRLDEYIDHLEEQVKKDLIAGVVESFDYKPDGDDMTESALDMGRTLNKNKDE
jgi:hypothetical protein